MHNTYLQKEILLAPAKAVRTDWWSEKAFTMAEVLITLGIIGIVAAMTLPSVIANAQKKAVASRVHKFYNTMNNALLRAIADYGDVNEWMPNAPTTYEDNENFFKMYILPYIKYTKYEKCQNPILNSTSICIYLQQGMMEFMVDENGGDLYYFVDGKAKLSSRNSFLFQFNKINGFDEDGNPYVHINNKTTIEPYTYGWDGKYESLTTAKRKCSKSGGNYCTKIMQLNNWEITDDYPW
ncbi:hypothetical protein DBY21_02310 [Candidatus Gastranaerophilales bacterium]|nr:MAG: hypothetical protein DBY21_02310 [Candidatus Gastranaerophilales bacterium]